MSLPLPVIGGAVLPCGALRWCWAVAAFRLIGALCGAPIDFAGKWCAVSTLLSGLLIFTSSGVHISLYGFKKLAFRLSAFVNAALRVSAHF